MPVADQCQQNYAGVDNQPRKPFRTASNTSKKACLLPILNRIHRISKFTEGSPSVLLKAMRTKLSSIRNRLDEMRGLPSKKCLNIFNCGIQDAS